MTFLPRYAKIALSRQKGASMNQKKKKLPVKWKWFLALTLIGIVIILFCPGYDFSGLFLLGLAALIPLYHWIGRIKKEGIRKGLTMTLTVFLVVFFSAIAITAGIIVSSSQGTEHPESEYLVVLGAGVNGTVPSLSLKQRLDATYEYLSDYPGAVAIVSGGQGSGEDITEAQCMYDYLTRKGIDPSRVWMEPEATSTLENLRFSLDVIESRTGLRPSRIAIVSSEYHLHRAGIFAGWLGLEAELVPAKTTILPLRWNYYLREVFAVWYYSLFGG